MSLIEFRLPHDLLLRSSALPLKKVSASALFENQVVPAMGGTHRAGALPIVLAGGRGGDTDKPKPYVFGSARVDESSQESTATRFTFCAPGAASGAVPVAAVAAAGEATASFIAAMALVSSMEDAGDGEGRVGRLVPPGRLFVGVEALPAVTGDGVARMQASTVAPVPIAEASEAKASAARLPAVGHQIPRGCRETHRAGAPQVFFAGGRSGDAGERKPYAFESARVAGIRQESAAPRFTFCAPGAASEAVPVATVAAAEEANDYFLVGMATVSSTEGAGDGEGTGTERVSRASRPAACPSGVASNYPAAATESMPALHSLAGGGAEMLSGRGRTCWGGRFHYKRNRGNQDLRFERQTLPSESEEGFW